MKQESLPLRSIIKKVNVTTPVTLSGDWVSGISKTIDIPYSCPQGYTPIGFTNDSYTLTANGVTGYGEWIIIGSIAIYSNSIRLQTVNHQQATIPNLSSFNPNITIACVKTDLIN